MTNYPFIPADWQKNASVLLMPLFRQPYFDKTTKTWVWGSKPCDLFWFVHEEPGSLLYDRLPQIGDHLYFQEEWWDDRVTTKPGEDFRYYLKSEDPHLTHYWYPAPAMPPEAATEWREIKSVKVLQAEKLTAGMFAKSGLESFLEVAPKWNKQFPDYPWEPELWIVALEIKEINHAK